MNVLSFPTLGMRLFDLAAETILVAKLIEDVRDAQFDHEDHRRTNFAMERLVMALMPKSVFRGKPRLFEVDRLFEIAAAGLQSFEQVSSADLTLACVRLKSAGVVEQVGQKYRLVLPDL